MRPREWSHKTKNLQNCISNKFDWSTCGSKTPPFAKNWQFLRNHFEKRLKLVFLNSQLSFVTSGCVLEKKSKCKKYLKLHFQQLLFYVVSICLIKCWNCSLSTVICGNRGCFRAKGHKLKVVGNAILKSFLTFSLERIHTVTNFTVEKD